MRACRVQIERKLNQRNGGKMIVGLDLCVLSCVSRIYKYSLVCMLVVAICE